MMKYPIGIQSFDKIILDGYVYVDKTQQIYNLVHTGTIYFLSRPRRFGKSLLVSTLKNYFLGRKELFKGLAIECLETEWAEYPVFHIDFNGDDFTVAGTLEKKINGMIESWEQIYGKKPVDASLGERFAYVLQQAHEQYGRGAVVLIDEYDKPILDVLDAGYSSIVDGERMLLEDRHRNILKAFYSVFKAADEHLKFVLLTGVTKFSQVSVFSGFNQPADISMDIRYETLCGITKEELYHYFAEPIKLLIYQSGYFTIKDYNMQRNTFLLDFPNEEVKSGFITVLAADYLKSHTDVSNWTLGAVDALQAGNVEQFRKLLTSFLADIPCPMRRKEDERERERYFHYTFYLLMRMISIYTLYTEKQQSEGRVDCIIETIYLNLNWTAPLPRLYGK